MAARPTVGLVPGSLIFIVIVAIWAAYLLQHWVHRREHAAATRSVDRFSKAMRILEKRHPLRATDRRGTRPHSYAVTLARPARPTVDVKRAVPVGSPRADSPLIARRSAAHAPTASEVDQMMPQSPNRSNRPGRPERGGQPKARPIDRRRPGEDGRPVVSRGQRRLRAGLLLASLVWVPVSITLVITGRLMWVSVPFALLTFAAVIFWLRSEATADRERAARGARPRAATDRTDRPAHQQRPPSTRRELTSEDTQIIDTASAAASAKAATRGGSAAYDIMAVEDDAATTGEPKSLPKPVPAAEPVAGTWVPVPVPRPTYAMKAKAEPRLTPGGIPADVFDTPEFADEVNGLDGLDELGRFARRAVGG